jgi:hypothetical protein
MSEHPDTNDTPPDHDTAAGRAQERRELRDGARSPPFRTDAPPRVLAEDDIGKLPLLPRDQRFPQHAPRRRSWRQTLRQRLSGG